MATLAGTPSATTDGAGGVVGAVESILNAKEFESECVLESKNCALCEPSGIATEDRRLKGPPPARLIEVEATGDPSTKSQTVVPIEDVVVPAKTGFVSRVRLSKAEMPVSHCVRRSGA